MKSLFNLLLKKSKRDAMYAEIEKKNLKWQLLLFSPPNKTSLPFCENFFPLECRLFLTFWLHQFSYLCEEQ